jgi:hypothetical protein
VEHSSPIVATLFRAAPFVLQECSRDLRRVDPGDEYDRDDHQQEPRTEFAQGHGLPHIRLVGIRPGTRPGADVLGQIDEHRHSGEDGQERQPDGAAPYAGMHDRGQPQHDDPCQEHPARIPPPVVGEEVDVDRGGQHSRQPPAGVAGEPEVEQPIHAHHVGADGRVHETAEQRDTADTEDAVRRVRPGADVGLEQLHRGAGDVEEHDHPEFTSALEAEHEHRHLDQDGRDRQRIVAGQCRVVGIPEAGRDDHHQQGRSEHARPCLFQHEHDELGESGAEARGRHRAEESASGRVDAALQGGGTLHASDRIGPSRQNAGRPPTVRRGQGRRGPEPEARSMIRATMSSAVVFSPGTFGFPVPW